MGKGDQKTRRGKIVAGSYGKLRKRKSRSSKNVSKPEVMATSGNVKSPK